MKTVISILACSALLAACVPIQMGAVPTGFTSNAATSPTQSPTSSPTAAATSQPTSAATEYGPAADGFPAGINPLTGLPVSNTDLLKIPAALVSISHFPPSGRPQSGLSFAPFVYEFSITRGETRFLAVFHGRFPEVERPVAGDCPVRTGVFHGTGSIIGNRVWLDANSNGMQDPDEEGIPGICVQIRNAQGTILQTTTTDTNGIYGFNIEPGNDYTLRFLPPPYLEFTAQNIGTEEHDSDVNPADGITDPAHVGLDGLSWDAGMVLNGAAEPALLDASSLPPAEVGPVRSGRLLYAHLSTAYTNSCLIYAFADPTILAKLPRCAFVSHEDANGGQMITIERMRAVAEDNMRRTADRPFSYASNLYAERPPTGGLPAERLDVYFNRINQSGWLYDPLYQAYLRQVDDGDVSQIGVLHPDVDRLTSRQLHFENVIILMADTEVITRTNLDIHLEGGNTGPASLFRDGRLYDIRWSTRGGEYEKKTGVRRPVQFIDADGDPVPLRPGSTWVIIVTPFSYFEPTAEGTFKIRYGPPAGEAQ